MKNNSIDKGISLTEDQHKAFNDIQEFLSSNDKEVFILKGYAGTGKTTLIHEVIQNLKSQKKYFEILAPTGRAAKILREKTEYGQTIHRGIYNLDKFETINDESEDEAEKSFHYHFPISDNRHKNRVCIIDEASMISDVEAKQEFFTFGVV